ncbi:hypothetical protein LEN26_000930 [Aphanomyces euteiches]|nr:hypothetical protein AeMF1_011680 [Aphanomyces euteiches]KAH9162518.1 hypothetical protein LEN26_000930 [Aphanomyces euteiches]KAH9188374.1 hypothetical protein AeNC1_009652 [Aphanomyces euteiches]
MWMDVAGVDFEFTSPNDDHVVIYAIDDNCYLCNQVAVNRENCDRDNEDCTDLKPNTSYEFTFGTVYHYDIELRTNNDNATVLWSTRHKFHDQANYSFTVDQSDSGNVQGDIVQTGDGTSSTLMTVILVLLLVWPLACFGLFSWRKQKSIPATNNELEEQILPEEQAQAPVKKVRVVCLDVFRGIAIFTMIFVNLGGGGYWYFTHAAWNGLTFADIVFPFFVWIMGVTMNISTASHLKKGTSLWRMLLDALFRAVRLFLLGLVVNDFRSLKHGRIPGVLQSFSFAYFTVSIAIIAGLAWQSSPWIRRGVEAFIVLAIVLTNLFIVFFLPVEGCPTGYFGPGGNGDGGLYPNCIGGAHLRVDLAIFGEDFMGSGGTAANVYGTYGPWDPEGFLNWLMVAFMAYIGYIVGGIFLNENRWVRKTLVLVSIGAVLALIGLGLAGFKINGGWIPINKNLWSLSFVLTVSGLACGVLAIMYLLVDKFAIWGGTPFKETGMNAIAIYMGHELLMDHAPFGWDRDASSHTQNTLSNLCGAICWALVGIWMHKKRIFITV